MNFIELVYHDYIFQPRTYFGREICQTGKPSYAPVKSKVWHLCLSWKAVDYEIRDLLAQLSQRGGWVGISNGAPQQIS